ncbi:hypothetical protein [Azospirillum sp. B4]|uniref:HAMP domain-containing protein n=1 Tax=Azospirillum sp. B4 TaxID=95605 RepID=UPI000345454E|nr:hypothetical protein [Azospirillum sp. B4]
MFSFTNFRIVAKILTMLGLLGIFSLAAFGFAAMRMAAIDESYGRLLSGASTASLAVARANRSLVFIERSIYEGMTVTDDAGNAKAVANYRKGVEAYEGFMEQAKTALPSRALEIATLQQEMRALLAPEGICGQTVDAAIKSSNADENVRISTTMMGPKCDPALLSLLDRQAKLADAIRADADAIAQQNHAGDINTIWLVFAVVLSGLALVGGVAFYLTVTGIGRPLQRVAGGLMSLGQGNYALEMDGVERRDKVGQMARAFSELKVGLIRARELEAPRKPKQKKKPPRGSRRPASPAISKPRSGNCPTPWPLRPTRLTPRPRRCSTRGGDEPPVHGRVIRCGTDFRQRADSGVGRRGTVGVHPGNRPADGTHHGDGQRRGHRGTQYGRGCADPVRRGGAYW